MSDFEPPGGRSPGPPPLPDEPPQPGWWKASDGNWYPPEQAPPHHAPPPISQPYGYPPQGYQPYTGGTPTNAIATWSLVLGITSIVLFWTFGFGVLLGILAIIFGVMGGNKAKELPGQLHGGRAKAGLVTGIIGTIGGALFFIVIFAAFDDVIDEIDSDPSDGVCNPDRFIQDPDC